MKRTFLVKICDLFISRHIMPPMWLLDMASRAVIEAYEKDA